MISLMIPLSRASILLFILLVMGPIVTAIAHPLGNFSINHFARIEVDNNSAKIRYVVDMAEVPTFQESQAIDTNQNGSLSEAELNVYLDQIAPAYLAGLSLRVDGSPVALKLEEKSIVQNPGAAGLSTIRMVFDLRGKWQLAIPAPRLRFENSNLTERAGWREIVVTPMSGASVFNSTAYGDSISYELKAYPEDQLQAPLNERSAEWSVTRGKVPMGARPLTFRDGKPVVAARERFAELISVPGRIQGMILLGLFLVFALGSLYYRRTLHK